MEYFISTPTIRGATKICTYSFVVDSYKIDFNRLVWGLRGFHFPTPTIGVVKVHPYGFIIDAYLINPNRLVQDL